MESEAKPNKAHHENGQEESLDPAKIAPTKFENYEALRSEDYEFKVRTTIYVLQKCLFSSQLLSGYCYFIIYPNPPHFWQH